MPSLFSSFDFLSTFSIKSSTLLYFIASSRCLLYLNYRRFIRLSYVALRVCFRCLFGVDSRLCEQLMRFPPLGLLQNAPDILRLLFLWLNFFLNALFILLLLFCIDVVIISVDWRVLHKILHDLIGSSFFNISRNFLNVLVHPLFITQID